MYFEQIRLLSKWLNFFVNRMALFCAKDSYKDNPDSTTFNIVEKVKYTEMLPRNIKALASFCVKW